MIWKLWTANRPTRLAVIDSERSWTFGELTAAAERLHLAGRVIPICEPNSAHWIARFLAIQKLGATALPLDPSLSSDAQRDVIRCVKARGCCIKLTSGTTGEFKAVYCTYGNLIADGRQICASMGIKPSDRNLALIPLGHSYGLGNLVMPLILQGTPIVCAQTIVPRQILDVIRAHRITVFPTVPAVLRALATLPATKPATLRLVISAGAPLSAEVAREFYERYRLKIHNFYGASETGGICYDRTGNSTLTGRSVGKPLKKVRVAIRRDKRVAVRSAAGNHVLPDLGAWNRYGELQLLGRVGVVANIGGKKISPATVESQLRKIAGVSDAWVTVLKDARGHDFLGAAIETERARDEIESELRARLALWQLPKRYFFARALPRTDRGKLDTSALRIRLEPTAPALG